MRRSSTVLVGIVLAGLALGRGVSADVNPVAARGWVTDRELLDAAVVGDTAYLAGTFEWIGVRSTTGESMLDPSTGGVLPGCARQTGGQGGLRPPVVLDPAGGLFMRVPYVPPPTAPGQLIDGDGVFAVPPGRSFVKVRSDCRFDRTFQLAEFVPGDLVTGGQTIARAGNLLYVGGSRSSGGGEGYGRIAVFDASTGARLVAHDLTQFGAVFVEGVAPDGRAVVVGRLRGVPANNQVTALVDVTNGTVTPITAAADLALVRMQGTTLYVQPSIGRALHAFDVSTGAPRAGWTPPVMFISDLVAAGERVFVAGGAAPIVALSASSGAVDTTWTAPPIDSTVERLAIFQNRLFARGRDVRGVGGVERFRLFALDAATGVVEPSWAPRVFAPGSIDGVGLVAYAGGVFVGALESEHATKRRNLAAVSLSSGAVLPFDPNAFGAMPAITMVAANGTRLFVASGNMVRSVSQATGAIEPWSVRADAVGLASTNARIATISATASTVYVGGFFNRLSGAAPVPTQVRSHVGAFDAATGAVSAWDPNVLGNDFVNNAPPVRSILVFGSSVAIGGAFTQVGGQTRHGLAVTDGATGAVTSPVSLTPGTGVGALTSLGGNVVFVGSQTVNGLAESRIGLANPSTGSVTLWFTGFVSGVGQISAFGRPVVVGGKVYANHEWDPTTGLPNPAVTGMHGVATSTGLLKFLDAPGAALHAEIVPAIPGAPQSLTANVIGSSVMLSWGAPAAPDALAPDGIPSSYVIRAGTAAGLFNLANFDTGTLSTSLSTSVPNGTYFVRVHARNAFGLGPASNEVSFTVGPQQCTAPPSPPGNLVAAVSGVAVTFSWSASAGAASYVLEAGSAPGLADLTAVNVGTSTGFAASAPPGTYYVRVRGSNACGSGGPSNEATVVLGTAVVLPGAPSTPTFTVDGLRTVTITWTPPATGGPATSYLLEAGSAPGRTDIAVAAVSGTTLVAPGVPPGVYHVRVRAVNAAGQGPPSGSVAISVP